jgi:small conductance mechanosensitive channel
MVIAVNTKCQLMNLPPNFAKLNQKLIRFVLISLLTFSLTWGITAFVLTPSAQSQIPSISSAGAHNSLSPPPEVTRYGEYETAPIRSPLDNKELFSLTSPTIFNRNEVPAGMLPVELRAETVNERLWRVLSRTAGAEKMPSVETATLNKGLIIQIRDDQFSRPIRLVTVTEPDADLNGKTLEELAEQWQKILQDEIARFKYFSSPEVFLQRVGQAFRILLILLVASSLIWFLRRVLTLREKDLESRYQQQLAAIIEAENTTEKSETLEGEETKKRDIANLRSQFLGIPQRQFGLKRRLALDKFLKWLLLWVFIVMWYLGIHQIMSTVPILMRWSSFVWTTPLVLLVIWFGISLAIRLSTILLDRLLDSWKTNPLLSFGEAQRAALRTVTISQALQGLVTFILVITGIIWTLSTFKIPTGSILAGGAVIGLAISFGSQSLVKDVVNGCLILIEDQFAVGDIIEIDGKGGLVENLNLRVTQLRNSEGKLITIPNSTITNVSNLTRLWSRVDFSIVVAYENDPVQVLDVLRQVCREMYDQPEWRERLPEPPEVLGIDEISHTGMLVRVWIKTAPIEQWSVGREFRLRVRQAFETNKIEIGRPQWINYTVETEKSPIQDDRLDIF